MESPEPLPATDSASSAFSMPVALSADSGLSDASSCERSRPLVFLGAVLLFLALARDGVLASSSASSASRSAFLRASSAFLAASASLGNERTRQYHISMLVMRALRKGCPPRVPCASHVRGGVQVASSPCGWRVCHVCRCAGTRLWWDRQYVCRYGSGMHADERCTVPPTDTHPSRPTWRGRRVGGLR